ncbi:MAG: HlyD family type I secretion periplasmic adaptor subunit [Sulfurimonadaceae bacterium]|jgi:adhesin transport system membrane fusion protein|nr:HlyD family type I secretion periplasmic adaptor subunit [Sulfurimonadaceae bacterium]
MKTKPKRDLTKRDLEFMHSLSGAVLEMAPRNFRIVLYFWAVAIFVFIIWAAFASIDELARGDGEVIPSGHNQKIQNLEGGIVEEILVREGQSVEKDEILLKIDNRKSQSSYSSNVIKANALTAKVLRLKAETKGENFVLASDADEFMKSEETLYRKNKDQLTTKLQILQEQVRQREQELREAHSSMKHLEASLSMLQQEVRMTKPMVDKGVKSKVDYLKLQRETNEAEDRYNATKLSIPRLLSNINEMRANSNEAKQAFKAKAQEQLNETQAELEGILANSSALEDQVTRTLVRSPMKGTVQTLFVNTIGGVIKPGDTIVEIVPSEPTLLVEVKIKPADIAFIYYGQKAIVKFSAYDFSIYGGIEGKVVHISADTIKDDKDNVFYTIRIETNKNYLERKETHHKIIPGMVANVDIITGQKTVLDYLLKPILKTKQYTFSER